MNESIHKFFRVGTLQWMSFPDKDPIDSLIQIACDDFFDAVEVKGYSNVSEQAQAAKLLNQSHLTVCYGAQPLELANGLFTQLMKHIFLVRKGSLFLQGNGLRSIGMRLFPSY